MGTGASLTAPERVRRLQAALHAKVKEAPGYRFARGVQRWLGGLAPLPQGCATRWLRQWLCRKHKVRAGRYVHFPDKRLWNERGLTRLAVRTTSFPWAKA